MTRNLSFLFIVALASTAALAGGNQRTADTVAIVGDAVITSADLENIVAVPLLRARTEEYKLKRELLERHIGEILFKREATARGIGVDELKKLEIEQKARPVTAEDKQAVFESSKERFGQSESEALERIGTILKRQRTEQRRAQYARELQARAGVRIYLEPPRLDVDPSDDPFRGPEDAPVTVVLFSDFQCPACATVRTTLDRLHRDYPEKVRVVFRDFPLPIHKDAEKAAEAAQCAHDQGKFWQMHDRLFANQQNLQVDSLKRFAAELGLDAGEFGRCLDSGTHAGEVKSDREAGTKYGVAGTPALYVNGRLLAGAVPYEILTSVVKEELLQASE